MSITATPNIMLRFRPCMQLHLRQRYITSISLIATHAAASTQNYFPSPLKTRHYHLPRVQSERRLSQPFPAIMVRAHVFLSSLAIGLCIQGASMGLRHSFCYASDALAFRRPSRNICPQSSILLDGQRTRSSWTARTTT